MMLELLFLLRLYGIFRYIVHSVIHYMIIFKYNHVMDYGRNIVTKDSIHLQQEEKEWQEQVLYLIAHILVFSYSIT
jgi:hypothetical protein